MELRYNLKKIFLNDISDEHTISDLLNMLEEKFLIDLKIAQAVQFGIHHLEVEPSMKIKNIDMDRLHCSRFLLHIKYDLSLIDV